MFRTAALAATVAAMAATGGCGSDDAGPSKEGTTGASAGNECEPTRADALGPFYEEGAPVRGKVGEGYVLSGEVRSAADCEPIPHVFIEFWLVGPNGEYDDAHRATVKSRDGSYRFESNRPVSYEGRPPHIHVLVTMPNDSTFVTQHYPEADEHEARFDITIPQGL